MIALLTPPYGPLDSGETHVTTPASTLPSLSRVTVTVTFSWIAPVA
jgi:hypothetical protein